MSIANLLAENNYNIFGASFNGEITQPLIGTSNFVYLVSEAGTLPVAAFAGNQIISANGAAGYALTLPSATLVLKLFYNPFAGQYFDFILLNNTASTGGTITFSNSADSTFQASENILAGVNVSTNRVCRCVILDPTGISTPSIFIININSQHTN